MSWTLTKKLNAFAGPGEIKTREVVLDPQQSPEEIKSREVELGSKSWTSFASVVAQHGSATVSYTHLTLPTNHRV